MKGFFPFFCFLSVTAGVCWGIVGGNVFLAAGGSILAFLGIVWAHRRQRLRFFEVFLLIFFVFAAHAWVLPSVSGKDTEYLSKTNTFEFRVSSIPLTRQRGRSFRAFLYRINGLPARIRALVRDFSSLDKQYPYRYQAEGKLSLRRWRQNEYYQLWIPQGSPQDKLPDFFVSDMVSNVTQGIIGLYRKYLPDAAGSFLAAVFLGRREFLGRDVRENFAAIGIVHLLAISGLHMGLFMWILMDIFKILRISFRRRIVLSLAGLSFYVVLVGGSVASVRAAIMCAIFGISFLLSRRTHPLNNLGLAGIIIVFLDPLVVTDIGFQLSFLSVAGIIFGYTLLNIEVHNSNFVFTYVKNILLSSFWVNVFIWPLLAWYFNLIYVLALFLNIVMIPLFALIIFTNCIFLLFSFLPVVNVLLAEVLSFLVYLFLQATALLSRIPFMRVAVTMPLSIMLVYYGVLGVLVARYFRRRYFGPVSVPET